VVIQVAREREESRGCHFRSDFPKRDDEKWRKHSRVSRGGEVKSV